MSHGTRESIEELPRQFFGNGGVPHKYTTLKTVPSTQPLPSSFTCTHSGTFTQNTQKVDTKKDVINITCRSLSLPRKGFVDKCKYEARSYQI